MKQRTASSESFQRRSSDGNSKAGNPCAPVSTGEHSAWLLIAQVPGPAICWRSAVTAACCFCVWIRLILFCILKMCAMENTTKACSFVFCIAVLLNVASSFDKAKKLHEALLLKSGYNKVIRPVINASHHIDVRLGLKLSQLIDVVSSHFYRPEEPVSKLLSWRFQGFSLEKGRFVGTTKVPSVVPNFMLI